MVLNLNDFCFVFTVKISLTTVLTKSSNVGATKVALSLEGPSSAARRMLRL